MKKRREILISLRKSQNLKQSDVANALSISTSYYGMIELGVRTPSLSLAANIAQYFKVNVEDIFLQSN